MKFKNIDCAVLALFALMILNPISAAAQVIEYNGLNYNILSEEEQTVEVAAQDPQNISGSISIPSEIQYNDKSYTVTAIGNEAFYECDKLTSVTIPSSVIEIGLIAFLDCGITSVTIPSSVIEIGVRAFCCPNLTSLNVDSDNQYFKSIDGILYNKLATEILSYPPGKEGEYVIPNSVTIIGNGAFSSCSNLTNFTIPKSVTKIGSSAFSFCSGLTSVTIPESVTEIGDGAFFVCKSLTNVTIPNSVTKIEDSTFSSCISLTSVTIPESVTIIGRSAFHSCSSLTSVTIPNSVTEIGEFAFQFCSGLTSISIPNSVTEIGEWAFSFCNLSSVSIPNSVTEIGEEAFNSCPLEHVYCMAAIPPSIEKENAFSCYETATLHVPAGTKDKYLEAENWNKFYSIVDDAETAGIDKVAANEDDIVTVYNANGVRVFDGPRTDMHLPSGYYIIKGAEKAEKLIVR